jgi:hypothetical protein
VNFKLEPLKKKTLSLQFQLHSYVFARTYLYSGDFEARSRLHLDRLCCMSDEGVCSVMIIEG